MLTYPVEVEVYDLSQVFFKNGMQTEKAVTSLFVQSSAWAFIACRLGKKKCQSLLTHLLLKTIDVCIWPFCTYTKWLSDYILYFLFTELFRTVNCLVHHFSWSARLTPAQWRSTK